ncbi:MAG TPA: trigger factor [Alphaproteobacteria bacterium]|jgi:trigger factor
MQVTETASEGLKREFLIRIPASDIETKLNARLQEMSAKVKQPGFRPGKVPMALLKKQYGPSLMGEILELAVAEGTREALDGKGLRPAMQPRIEIKSFAEGGDLEYSIAVELIPEIKPPSFSDIKIEKPTVAIDDAAIDEAAGRLLENNRVYEKTEDAGRQATKEDALLVDFIGRVGGTAFDGGTAKDFEVAMDSAGFIPGFVEQMHGAKAGDKLTVKVKFPDDYGNADLAGKDAEFEVDVKEVRVRKVSSLDDAFAKSVGFESLAELRKGLKERMEQEYSQVTRMRVKRNLLDKLADKCDFETPKGLVDNEFAGIWQQMTGQAPAHDAETCDDPSHDHSHDHHGHDHGDHAGHDHDHDHDHGDHEGHDHGPATDVLKGKSPEEIEKLKAEYRAIAERRVKLGLLLSETGRANNIEISKDDLNRALINEARRYPGQERQVFEFYQKNPDALEQLRAPVFEDKVIDYILELAKVEERKVTAEELMRDPDEDADAAKA